MNFNEYSYTAAESDGQISLATLLLKVMAKSVCHYKSKGSSLFLCGLLLKSLMGQLLVGSAKHAQVTSVVYLMLLMVHLCVRTYYASII